MAPAAVRGDRIYLAGWGVAIVGGLLLIASGSIGGNLALTAGGAATAGIGLALVGVGLWTARRPEAADPTAEPVASEEEVGPLSPWAAEAGDPEPSLIEVPVPSASLSAEAGSETFSDAPTVPELFEPIEGPSTMVEPPAPALSAVAMTAALPAQASPEEPETIPPEVVTESAETPVPTPAPTRRWSAGPSLPFVAGASRSQAMLVPPIPLAEGWPPAAPLTRADLMEEVVRLRHEVEELAHPVLVPGLSVLRSPAPPPGLGPISTVPAPPASSIGPQPPVRCVGCGTSDPAVSPGKNRCWGCGRAICIDCFWRYGPGPSLHRCPECAAVRAPPSVSRSGARARPSVRGRPSLDDEGEWAEGL